MRLIDADALIEQMETDMEQMEEPLAKMFTGAAIHDVRHAPTIEPERKTGHWIAITSRNNTYKCSVCGRLLVNITDGKNKVAKNYPYCHCGADMRGEQE